MVNAGQAMLRATPRRYDRCRNQELSPRTESDQNESLRSACDGLHRLHNQKAVFPCSEGFPRPAIPIGASAPFLKEQVDDLPPEVRGPNP